MINSEDCMHTSFTHADATPELRAFVDYDAFATYLRQVDKRDDVLVTIWQGTYS